MARVLPPLVCVASFLVAALCAAVLGSFVALDAHAGSLIAGTRSRASALREGTVALAGERPLVVAHNAGDNLATARRAVAWRAGAVEIDVRRVEGVLVASHDAPLPLLEDVMFRAPSLQQAWDVAARRGTVLLHLKQHSGPYLAAVGSFVRAQPRRQLILQSNDTASLQRMARELPDAQRLLLIANRDALARLRADPWAAETIGGVSLRDRLATPAVLAWLRADRLFVIPQDGCERPDYPTC